VDQAAATIIAAVIALSGSVTAAIIAVKWKSRSEPQHHVHEHRLLYPMVVEHEPWIRSGSPLARIVRAGCWTVATLLLFIGTGALLWSAVFIAGPTWLGIPESPHRNLIVVALLPTGILALIVGHWIGRASKSRLSLRTMMTTEPMKFQIEILPKFATAVSASAKTAASAPNRRSPAP
jgi:hypothetical protein